MAGTVSLSPDVRWSAASWLFDWVLRDIARDTDDVELAGHLTGVVGENLGWFGLDDITPRQRREVRRIITEHLVDDANKNLPADLPGRPETLALLSELAAKFSALAEG